MARAGTTTDVFNAVAERKRREIIDLLAGRGALAAGVIVAALGLPQPAVSKHLGVLRKVGVVSVHKQGQRRVYRLEPEGLRVMHDWIKQYERLWTNQLDRVKERAERLQREADARTQPRKA